jgi:putative SOS response-associated peptidase YedK
MAAAGAALGQNDGVCGRYVSVAADSDLVAEFDAEAVIGEPPAPSWNVAPTDQVRVVLQRASDPVRSVRTVRWGLLPSWSRDRKGAAKMINARIETVTEKPAFRAAAARRRCLVPALGYYEWQKTDHGKVAHFLHDPDGQLLAMAGLYELWADSALAEDDPNRWVWTCAVITQQATDALGEIHDRSPVVIPRRLRAEWLDCSPGQASVAADVLSRVPPARLEPYVVGPAVGNVANNGPELMRPVR